MFHLLLTAALWLSFQLPCHSNFLTFWLTNAFLFIPCCLCIPSVYLYVRLVLVSAFKCKVRWSQAILIGDCFSFSSFHRRWRNESRDKRRCLLPLHLHLLTDFSLSRRCGTKALGRLLRKCSGESLTNGLRQVVVSHASAILRPVLESLWWVQ